MSSTWNISEGNPGWASSAWAHHETTTALWLRLKCLQGSGQPLIITQRCTLNLRLKWQLFFSVSDLYIYISKHNQKTLYKDLEEEAPKCSNLVPHLLPVGWGSQHRQLALQTWHLPTRLLPPSCWQNKAHTKKKHQPQTKEPSLILHPLFSFKGNPIPREANGNICSVQGVQHGERGGQKSGSPAYRQYPEALCSEWPCSTYWCNSD